MQITKNKVVSIDYKLTDQQGAVLDTSNGRAPLVYLHGSGSLIPGLEKQLEGKSAGEKLSVDIPPAEAYGFRNEGLVQSVPRSAFRNVDKIEKGMKFNAQGPQGGPHSVTVAGVENDTIQIDANHPLAGKALHFDVTIIDVRDPTPEEARHGHAHGPGGHQH
jgi:FKBP-type peptidyl-prolyl cis-trans isomerase SlyD